MDDVCVMATYGKARDPRGAERTRGERAPHETCPPPVPSLLALLRPSCSACDKWPAQEWDRVQSGELNVSFSEADGTLGSISKREKAVVTAPWARLQYHLCWKWSSKGTVWHRAYIPRDENGGSLSLSGNKVMFKSCSSGSGCHLGPGRELMPATSWEPESLGSPVISGVGWKCGLLIVLS